MLTIRNSFYKNLTFNNLLNAYILSKKGKDSKFEVLKFTYNLEIDLINLIELIATFKYKIGIYKEFTIYEPKKRIIRSLPFIDRVVQTWYIEYFIKPYFIPRFIYDSYSCIIGKGTHKAVKRLQYFMNCMKRKYKSYYVIKFDISKFFDSIDKDILYRIMSKYISDKYLLKFTYDLIYSYKYNGIPIGNYSSQYFANIYLNELDYYIKYKLNIKYYIRYMDDFVILIKDKIDARYIYDLIEIFVNHKLNLKLNKKSNYFPNELGIDFCGYIIYEKYLLVRKRSIKKIKKKIKIWNCLYELGGLDNKKFVLSFNSWLGHISHANSYNLKNKVLKSIKFVF